MCISGSACARLSLHNRMCVSVCVGDVHTPCRSMCAGTSTWRPCLTGPQCVRPDAKPTWQKQIMSAPVIFSSPSAPQEPFKGPNTDEITHRYPWTHMHVYSRDAHTHCAHIYCVKQAHMCTTQTRIRKREEKHTNLMLTFSQLMTYEWAPAQIHHLKPQHVHKHVLNHLFTHAHTLWIIMGNSSEV